MLQADDRLDRVQQLCHGRLEDEYEIYRSCADDGKGGDRTNGGLPLKSFEEWMQS
jgi:hypothetical protein